MTPSLFASAPSLFEQAVTRRHWLRLIGAGSLALQSPLLFAANATPTRIVGTWQDAEGFAMGVIQVPPAADQPILLESSLRLPTRAHGLQVLPSGDVLLNARRPGDWLVRWTPGQRKEEAQWQWIDDDHRYNGHVLADNRGRSVFTTETRLSDGQGVLGVRDPRTLARTATWETGGQDPHMMLQLPVAMGPLPAGTLIVANGGVPTQTETGRVKLHMERMDPSLVALDPVSGGLLGQWRLADQRLSIRHLAFDPESRQVGIALQAEHDDEATKLSSPILAIFDGKRLFAPQSRVSFKGYGGDICARPEGGFAVSCPKSDRVALFDGDGSFGSSFVQADVCALVADGLGHWWAAGKDAISERASATEPSIPVHSNLVASSSSDGHNGAVALSPRWDNHWRLLSSTA